MIEQVWVRAQISSSSAEQDVTTGFSFISLLHEGRPIMLLQIVDLRMLEELFPAPCESKFFALGGAKALYSLVLMEKKASSRLDYRTE